MPYLRSKGYGNDDKPKLKGRWLPKKPALIMKKIIIIFILSVVSTNLWVRYDLKTMCPDNYSWNLFGGYCSWSLTGGGLIRTEMISKNQMKATFPSGVECIYDADNDGMFAVPGNVDENCQPQKIIITMEL